jgi:hypothetical protein
MRKILITSFACLALGVLLVTYALAAGTVTIRVLNEGVPEEGAVVELIASDGTVSGVTNDTGEFTTDISGRYFRLKVQDTVFAEPFLVEDSPVVVELTNL